MRIVRLRPGQRDLARALFATLAETFGEEHAPCSDGYIDEILAGDEFWAFAAIVDGFVAGGITAHRLPMTKSETYELFVYDLAVRPEYRRQGVGRSLLERLREDAAAEGLGTVFVAADDGDAHALEFYRAAGGTPSPATIFSF